MEVQLGDLGEGLDSKTTSATRKATCHEWCVKALASSRAWEMNITTKYYFVILLQITTGLYDIFIYLLSLYCFGVEAFTPQKIYWQSKVYQLSNTSIGTQRLREPCRNVSKR
jgi:hypothetical protein